MANPFADDQPDPVGRPFTNPFYDLLVQMRTKSEGVQNVYKEMRARSRNITSARVTSSCVRGENSVRGESSGTQQSNSRAVTRDTSSAAYAGLPIRAGSYEFTLELSPRSPRVSLQQYLKQQEIAVAAQTAAFAASATTPANTPTPTNASTLVPAQSSAKYLDPANISSLTSIMSPRLFLPTVTRTPEEHAEYEIYMDELKNYLIDLFNDTVTYEILDSGTIGGAAGETATCACVVGCTKIANASTIGYGRDINTARIAAGVYDIGHLIDRFIDAFDEETQIDEDAAEALAKKSNPTADATNPIFAAEYT